MSIQVSLVSKFYNAQKALNEVSFSADKGQVIGFLGPNGAGKSTMMKILTGFVKPSSGNVFVDEIDVLQNPLEAQNTIGYLPEHNPLYKDMYVREYLQFQASIFKIDKNQIENCIEKVGLDEISDTKNEKIESEKIIQDNLSDSYFEDKLLILNRERTDEIFKRIKKSINYLKDISKE